MSYHTKKITDMLQGDMKQKYCMEYTDFLVVFYLLKLARKTCFSKNTEVGVITVEQAPTNK